MFLPAVEFEDLQTIERLMRSWYRVNITKNKPLSQLADESSNIRMIRLFERYKNTNELACHAFACDTYRVKELLKKGN